MHIPYSARVACLLLAVGLVACSPDHNWREIAFEGTAFKAQLPCKPDRTTRVVPLGAVPVDLQVAGCDSGNATVAVMTAALQTGVDAQAVLAGWQQATLANARVHTPLADGQMRAWLRPGFLPLPSAQRVQATGQRPDGQPVVMEAVWGVLPEGAHLRVVHAVVYDRRAVPELANPLIESLHP